jgi:hypothetical protein
VLERERDAMNFEYSYADIPLPALFLVLLVLATGLAMLKRSR